MIAVTTCLRLEVETTPPVGMVKSLVKNPDGRYGGSFWVTPNPAGVDTSFIPNSAGAWLRYSHSTGATGLRTERMPVVVGQYVSARWKMYATSGTNTMTATIAFEDGNGATISTTAASPAYTTAPTTDRTYGPFLVPANAVNARLIYTPASVIPGQVVEFQDVGFVCRASNAVVVWATDVVDGPTWLDVLAPTVDIDLDRNALDLGLLTATIRDATLDPTIAPTIRPGRACRLSALHGTTGTWEVMFEGEVTDFDVRYEAGALARKPGDPKHCKITLAACDRTRTLASVRRPEGVSTMHDVRDTLEDVGVPWSINGNTGHTGVPPTILSYNENATALDQVALTRDSRAAHAWVDRRGVLQLWDRANLAPLVNTGFEVDLAQWTTNGGTITRVTTPTASGVGALRLVSGTGAAHTLTTDKVRITPGHPYSVSVQTRAATLGRPTRVSLEWRDRNNGNAGTTTGALTTNTTTGWTTHTVTCAPGAIPADAVYVRASVVVTGITAAGETFYVDDLIGLGAEVLIPESVWTDIEIGGGSKQCINEVTVDFLRYAPASGTVGVDYRPPGSEVIPYGPYRHEGSIAEFGVRPKKFTIHGTSEVADAAAFAAQVLAANAYPKVSASSVTFPVKSTADLVMTRALADLQQVAYVSFTTKGYSEALRITGIRHSIKADAKYKARWIVTLTFESTSTVAAPRSIPAPPQAARTDPGAITSCTNDVNVTGTARVGKPDKTVVVNIGIKNLITWATYSWSLFNVPTGYRPKEQAEITVFSPGGVAYPLIVETDGDVIARQAIPANTDLVGSAVWIGA